MKNLFLVIALFFSFTSTALNYDNCHPYNCLTITGIEKIDLEKIFFINESEDLVFVDFQSISLHIYEIKITQNGKDLLLEDVKELDQNMIYEVDLTFFVSGDYSIELLIADDTKIKMPLTIK